jgi:hypothetical protein
MPPGKGPQAPGVASDGLYLRFARKSSILGWHQLPRRFSPSLLQLGPLGDLTVFLCIKATHPKGCSTLLDAVITLSREVCTVLRQQRDSRVGSRHN